VGSPVGFWNGIPGGFPGGIPGLILGETSDIGHMFKGGIPSRIRSGIPPGIPDPEWDFRRILRHDLIGGILGRIEKFSGYKF